MQEVSCTGTTSSVTDKIHKLLTEDPAHFPVCGESLKIGADIFRMNQIKNAAHIADGQQIKNGVHDFVTLFICHAGKPGFDGHVQEFGVFGDLFHGHEVRAIQQPGVKIVLQEANLLTFELIWRHILLKRDTNV